MSARRVEITLSESVWDRLESARGHEPRASFIKRALDFALDDERMRSPADIAAIKKVWDSPELMEQMQGDDTILERVESTPPRVRGIKGVKTTRELAMERQRKMNERKS
jgi:hypothetical protein